MSCGAGIGLLFFTFVTAAVIFYAGRVHGERRRP